MDAKEGLLFLRYTARSGKESGPGRQNFGDDEQAFPGGPAGPVARLYYGDSAPDRPAAWSGAGSGTRGVCDQGAGVWVRGLRQLRAQLYRVCLPADVPEGHAQRTLQREAGWEMRGGRQTVHLGRGL